MALSQDVIDLVNKLDLYKKYRMVRFENMNYLYSYSLDNYINSLKDCGYIEVNDNKTYFRVLKRVPSDINMSNIIKERKNILKTKNRKDTINKFINNNIVYNNTNLASKIDYIKDKITNIIAHDYDKDTAIKMIEKSNIYIDNVHIFVSFENGKVMLFKYEDDKIIHFDYNLLHNLKFNQLVKFDKFINNL